MAAEQSVGCYLPNASSYRACELGGLEENSRGPGLCPLSGLRKFAAEVHAASCLRQARWRAADLVKHKAMGTVGVGIVN